MSIDTRSPQPARMYDYMLGGGTHFAADRRLAEEMSRPLPGGVGFGQDLARRNRAFMCRVVQHLAVEQGISQFLDVGAGIPVTVNTYDMARSVAPDSRVVYVDHDPIVLAYAHERLGSAPEGTCDYVHADLHDADEIAEAAADTLDLDRPVGILLLAVLHLVADDEDPRSMVERLLRVVPSGSFLAISHFTADIFGEEMREMTRIYTGAGQTLTLRSHAEVAALLDGLEVIEPGVVLVEDWHPDDAAGDPLPMYGALARKP